MNKILDRHIDATELVSMPTFTNDMSRIVDMWGYLEDYAYYSSEEEADFAAIKKDYNTVMSDIRESTEDHEQKSKKEEHK